MLLEQVEKTIKKYQLIESGDKIVVCVSGGPDSMCLLHILGKIKKKQNDSFSICVAHVNHKIRQEADEETKYVEDYCKKNDIECFVKKCDVIDIAKEEKRGLEETGRKIRYAFFEEVANKVGANKIAIAHNENDTVETVLMNVIRGSGSSGLKGIEPIRDKRYIRPLIETKREQIENYCEENNLDPKIDQSNFDNKYTRNKVRNELIPYLKEEFNPNIIDSIQKLSEIITDEQNYLEKMVHNIYEQAKIKESQKEIILDLKKFNEQDIVIKRRLTLYTISKLFGSAKNIEKIHVEDIIKLCKRNIGNKYLTPNKNTKVFLKKGKIFFMSIV